MVTEGRKEASKEANTPPRQPSDFFTAGPGVNKDTQKAIPKRSNRIQIYGNGSAIQLEGED